MPKEQKQLTEFQSSTPVTEQFKEEPVGFDHVLNPYPDETPYDILSRVYKVAEFNWGPVTGTNYLDFPVTLTNIPVLAERLKNFRFMKSGVILQVRLLSTQFHYGAYMVSWIPNHADSSHATDYRMQSGNRPIVLSAAMQDASAIHIPYINPYSYFNPQDNSNEIARVFFTPITALHRASPDVTDTIKVQIYASFDYPEVSGYIAQSGTKSFKDLSGRERSQQLKKWRAERATKSSAPPVPARGTEYNRAARNVRYEAIKKTASGVVETASSATSTIGSFFEKIPIIGGLVEGAVSPILKALSILDKPSNLGVVQYVSPQMGRDMSHGNGLDNSNSLGLYPLSLVSMDLKFCGEDLASHFMTVSRIIKTPMIHDSVTFGGPTNTWSKPCVPRIPDQPDDYLAFMSRFFGFWRGSFKYKICFYTSTFISARFRISVRYDSTVLTDNNAGDVTSRIVDVKGDTHLELTVPYLWDTMYRQSNPSGETYFPYIDVTLTSPIIGSSIAEDPLICMVVWRAAGEDFKFNQLVTWDGVDDPDELFDILDTTSTDDIEAQMDPNKEFRKTFPGIIDDTAFTCESGTITGEEIDSLNDICKRYVDNINGNAGNTYPNPNLFGPFHKLASIFKYWRGSRRVKCKPDHTSGNYDTLEVVAETVIGLGDAANGMNITVPEIWPWIETEIPWYSTLPYIPTDANSVSRYTVKDNPKGIIYSNQTQANAGRHFISAGDDFVYIFLISPP